MIVSLLYRRPEGWPAQGYYSAAAMRTGIGARLEPLLIAATTAGNDPTSFAKSEHDECVKNRRRSDPCTARVRVPPQFA